MGLFMWSPDNPAPTFGNSRDKKLGMAWEQANLRRRGQVQASGQAAAAGVLGSRISTGGALERQGLAGRQSMKKQTLAGEQSMRERTLMGEQAMGLQGLRGRQAMDVEGLRESGAYSRAMLGGQAGAGGGISNGKMVDVPMYNESGSMVIGTTPAIVDMDTGKYTKLQEKKKKAGWSAYDY